MSRTPYYDSLVAAGLVESDYVFAAGHLYDIVGGLLVSVAAGAGSLQRGSLDVAYHSALCQSSGLVWQTATEGTVMAKIFPIKGNATASYSVSDLNAGATKGNVLHLNTTASPGVTFTIRTNIALSGTTAVPNSIQYNEWSWISGTFKNNDANGIMAFVNGVQTDSTISMTGKTYVPGDSGVCFGNRVDGIRPLGQKVARVIRLTVALTDVQQQTLQAELDSISYPTSVYEIRPPQYPTIKDGTPASTLDTMTPSTTTAVYDTKDSNMAPYKQFTRTLSSSIDYGIQTQNQLNAEFEWDGCVYFDTDSVGQAVGIVKIGDVATGVSWGLQKSATEKFQFVYGADATVNFAYSVPSLGPLHIVLRREFNGSDWDLKLWVNGEYKETLTGAYAGTGNASAKTILGANLSGRIYYSNIYQHLRPIEKFQRDPFDKNMTLGWGIRASTILDNVETDTDGVVRVISGGATFKVNAGRGTDGKLEKFLETTAAGATFYIRNVTNGDGVKLYYRTAGTLEWTEGDGSTGVTVAADGLFTMPATTQFLWAKLGGNRGMNKGAQ